MRGSRVPFSPDVRKITTRRFLRPLKNASAPPHPMMSSSGCGEITITTLPARSRKGFSPAVAPADSSRRRASMAPRVLRGDAVWGVSLTKSPPRTLPRRYVEQKALLWHNRLSCSVEPTFEVTSLDLNDSLEFHVREVASVAGGVNRGPRALEE